MRSLTWLSLGLGAVACGGDSLSSSEYDDIAAIVASGIATPDRGGDFGVAADALTLARGSLPKGFRLESDSTVTGARGPIVYHYEVSCLQAWGLAACDPPAQSAIVRAAWSGELTMSAFVGPIDGTAVLRLDHLATPMAEVTGDSQLAAQQATFVDSARSYSVATTTELLLFADMPSHFMMGGAFESSLEVAAPSGSYTVKAELSMTGEPTATLVLDGDHAYVVDLASGAIGPN